MEEFRISVEQESPGQPHVSGSTVTGHVIVVANKPKSYEHISIGFHGKAYVHWLEQVTEGYGDQRATRIVHYTGSEVYVDEALTLWTSKQSPDGRLPVGEHSFPFSFNIPRTAPSSFEGTFGSITYTLKGLIGTGLLKFDRKVESKIKVQQVKGISDPGLLQPVHKEVQKTICCCCCASGPVVMTVAIPKTGFNVGETFPLQVSLENGSSRKITLSASIVRSIEYTAGDHNRYGADALVNAVSQEIGSHSSNEWEPSIQIPATEILDEQSCRIIKISHSLVVTAVIDMALDLDTDIPLKLGNDQTIPFENGCN